MTPLSWAARRNAVLASATAGAVAWLLLYPTSTAGRPDKAAATTDTGASGAVAKTRNDGAVQVDGPVVDTAYGPVQVRILYRDGRIEIVEIPVYPRASLVDKAINDDAVRQLRDQTLIDQTPEVDTVSGATQTSEAYRTSLQAALDAAHAAPAEEVDVHAEHSDAP